MLHASVIDAFDLDGANPWRTQDSRVVYDNGFLRVREDRVVQPDGRPGTFAYLDTPWPVVGIVPLTESAEVYLVRQWRYPWKRNSWEIPAGHGEAGESPLEAARRELAEEVGLAAADWQELGSAFASASLSARFHLFLARGLRPEEQYHVRDSGEADLIARPVPIAEALEAAVDGRIDHGMSVVGLLRAARLLGL